MPLKGNPRESLKPGEQWTFLGVTDEQMADVAPGSNFSQWWSTDEPGRLFMVDRVHPALHAVETTFTGFQEIEVSNGD